MWTRLEWAVFLGSFLLTYPIGMLRGRAWRKLVWLLDGVEECLHLHRVLWTSPDDLYAEALDYVDRAVQATTADWLDRGLDEGMLYRCVARNAMWIPWRVRNDAADVLTRRVQWEAANTEVAGGARAL
jgi:hypothetical protein